ncbi:hypothetical protein GGX14DRAFT_570053 [Mycena pura]|uniref:Uncharacterized protein n=1 Tax=Mycena pura TaxID=153505 RepID=A0AAD6V6K6_9AGAR|nr:hypothetical protein GGX14DRAFT_570053 [Mycena pura]
MRILAVCRRFNFDLQQFLSWAVHGILGFNFWVKMEAHNVVASTRPSRIFFDGGAAPYAFCRAAPRVRAITVTQSLAVQDMRAISLNCGSYAVPFICLAGTLHSFVPLVCFEDPHTLTEPLPPTILTNSESQTLSAHMYTTPPAAGTSSTTLDGYASTEDDMATETGLEPGTKDGEIHAPAARRGGHQPKPSDASSTSVSLSKKKQAMSQRDLFIKQFRRDTIILKNIDLFGASDARLLLVNTYSLAMSFVPHMSERSALGLHSRTRTRARLVISEVVQDTKVLLQRLRERLVNAWVVYAFFARSLLTDVCCKGVSLTYKLDAVHGVDGSLHYQLGQPCPKWDSQHHRSRKYWVGIIGDAWARTSSMGMWSTMYYALGSAIRPNYETPGGGMPVSMHAEMASIFNATGGRAPAPELQFLNTQRQRQHDMQKQKKQRNLNRIGQVPHKAAERRNLELRQRTNSFLRRDGAAHVLLAGVALSSQPFLRSTTLISDVSKLHSI